MDWQYGFNVVSGIAAAALGWLLKLVYDEVRDHRDQLGRLPETYARRDDVKDRFDDIVRLLERIEDKVDSKKSG